MDISGKNREERNPPSPLCASYQQKQYELSLQNKQGSTKTLQQAGDRRGTHAGVGGQRGPGAPASPASRPDRVAQRSPGWGLGRARDRPGAPADHRPPTTELLPASRPSPHLGPPCSHVACLHTDPLGCRRGFFCPSTSSPPPDWGLRGGPALHLTSCVTSPSCSTSPSLSFPTCRGELI